MLDIIIRNGTVVDGTGRPGFLADVGIQSGRVSAIGQLQHVEATHVLDASRLIVAPGFIDIHSHSDYTLLVDPRAQSSIAQGVTTELVGNCGHGCAPIVDPELARGNIYGYDPRLPITWHTVAEYLDRLDQARPAVNVLTLVPNGMLRIAVSGLDERSPGPAQLRQMARLLTEGLEQGAVGFSVGLEYPLERSCSADDMTQLCRIVSRYDGLFAPHLRNKDVRAIEAVDEALRVAAEADVRMHIPHLSTRRGAPPDADAHALARIDRANSERLDVSIDMHTRLHGLTNLSVALPAWAYKGGPDELRKRLRSPQARAEFARHDSLLTSLALGGWRNVSVLTSAARPDLIGKNFEEIGLERATTPFDAALDLLLDEAADPHYPLILAESYTEAQLLETYRHPACLVASDATALGVDGPLAGKVFHGAFTWAAWFFRRFVREERVFTVEQAVRKLTAQPAARLNLSDRGVLREGACADVFAFDPHTYGDQGTLNDPNRLARGTVHVVVNGVAERRNGQFTGDRNGRVLRR